jgi:multidrug efflux pump subunit AcrA (membrane-fusion protein)
MKSYSLPLTLLAGFALLTGCGGHSGTSPAASSKPVPVQVLTLQQTAVPTIVEAPGTVQPRNRISLSSQINGFVREMNVRVGDAVPEGKILALLDARDSESQKAGAQAAIDEAQAAVDEARQASQAAAGTRMAAKASRDLADQTLARYEKLFASRSVSPQEIDEIRMRQKAAAAEWASREFMLSAAEDRFKQAEAKIAQAKAQSQRADVLMGWTQIKAPSAGKIAERLADPGTAIFPGTPLLVLESTINPQILASIPTEQAKSLHPGMQVRIRIESGKETLEGRISEIAPLSNPATHSVQFKVDLPQSTGISNGQFAIVLVPIGTRKALLAPNTAIHETGQLTGLYAIDEASIARFRLAKITPYDADHVEILSGIEAGEKIAARLDSRIVDGIAVEARP